MAEDKLLIGEDLSIHDNILDPITFEELITTVHCNCRKINPYTVCEELERIAKYRISDMCELLERNAETIINLAKEGRETA